MENLKPSRTRLFFSTVVLALFSALSVYFLYQGPNPNSSRAAMRNGPIFYTVCSIGAVLFGVMALYGIKRLIFERKTDHD